MSLPRTVLRALIVLNFVYGAGILAMFILSLAAPTFLFRSLGVILAAEGSDVMIRGMRAIMVAGLISIPLNHGVLSRLLAIVDTVRGGEPFIIENARRLQTIAWCVAGLEVLHLFIGAVALSSGSSAQPLDINWSFSFTPWIAVLLLFVLARVFDQGARMREDLEGTV